MTTPDLLTQAGIAYVRRWQEWLRTHPEHDEIAVRLYMAQGLLPDDDLTPLKKDGAREPTVKQLLPLIDKYMGNISAIARHFGLSRATIYNRIHESTNLQTALQDARETTCDDAISTIYTELKGGNITAVAYYLNNSPEARKRGWGVKQTDGAKGTIDDPAYTVGMTLDEWQRQADERRRQAEDTTDQFDAD